MAPDARVARELGEIAAEVPRASEHGDAARVAAKMLQAKAHDRPRRLKREALGPFENRDARMLENVLETERFEIMVLPVPRSPESATRTGARSVFANSLPQAMVSSADCVTTSTAAVDLDAGDSDMVTKLLNEAMARLRHGIGDFPGKQAGRVRTVDGEIRCTPVQIHAERKDAGPILRAELPRDAGENSGEHVA